MEKELLQQLKARYRLEDIVIVDKHTRTSVSEKTYTDSISEWVSLSLRMEEGTIRETGDRWVYNGEDVMVVLIGRHKYDEGAAASFLKEHEAWLKLLLHHTNEQKRKNALHVLTGVSHTLSSRMYEEGFLQIILDSVVDAVTAADSGFLFLYDEKIGKLLVEAAVGFRDSGYKKTRLKPGEGVSGRVFESGRASLLQGTGSIKEAMETMSAFNYEHYLEAAEERSIPESMLSVPLLFHKETIGVLTLDSFRDHPYLTEHDLHLVEALADHIAVVIMHARLYRQEKRQREALQQTHLALRKEHETMQRTTDFHHRLTNVAASGGGVQGIIQTMKTMVRYPFAVYDALLKPLFVDEEAGEKGLPDRFLSHDRVKKVIKMNKWQQIAHAGEQLVVLPITGPVSVWGFVCVWIDSADFFENDIVLFEYGTTVLSLELTKEDSIREAEQQAKGQLVEGILTGERDPVVEVQASNLGLYPADFYAMVLCHVDPDKMGEEMMTVNSRRQREEIGDALESVVTKLELNGIVSMNRSYVFAMISFPESEGKGSARQKMKALVHMLERSSAPLKAGVGRVHKNLFQLNKSYADAEKCIQVLKTKPSKNVMSFVDAGFYRFLLQNSEEDLSLYVSDFLGPLMRYDKEKNNDMLHTLITYVRFDKDLKKVTKELNIHHNTLYYRINRVQEILDVTFDRFDDWFNVQLACRVYEYLQIEERDVR